MSNLTHRENTILPADSGDGEPVFGASYTVTVYATGARVTSVSGTTVNVEAGHGLISGQYTMLENDASTFTRIDTSGATSITTNADISLSLAAGDLLVNLGTDGATGGTPDYDGSTVVIYSDMAGSDSITNSRVVCNAQGKYGYWMKGSGATTTSFFWELVRDSSGTPVDLIPDVVGHYISGPASATDNAITRFNGTTANLVQSSSATLDDTGVITATGMTNTGNSSITGTLTVTGLTSLNGGLQLDTNKFTVADTSGNTVIAGTLDVAGAMLTNSTLEVDGTASLYSNVAFGVTAGITANAGGLQASAVALTTTINEVSTCATTNDSVKLPAAVAGLFIIVINNGAAEVAVYPASTEQIGGGTASYAAQIAAGDIGYFFARNTTNWDCTIDDKGTGTIAPT